MINSVRHEAVAIQAPGAKSGRAAAVGQQAKAAVAAARDAGVDLPKNAQGLAASAIARGAAPESVFAGLVSPPPGDGGGSTGGAIDNVPGEIGVVPAEVVDDVDANLGVGTADGEAVLPPVAVPGGDDITAEETLSAGISSAEIALETLVSKESDEGLGQG